MSEQLPVFTIGYGNRAIEAFIDLLRAHEIQWLLDTRSHPHSRHRPEYNRDALRAAVEAAGRRYDWMGEALGGKRREPEVKRAGRVDFDLVRALPTFLAGIDEIIEARRSGTRLAVMCAELKPEQCHRTWLIAPALLERGIPVLHIDETGSARTHEQVLARGRSEQPSLF